MEDNLKEVFNSGDRLTIKLTQSEKRRLKVICADLNITMTKLIKEIITRTLDSIEQTGGFKFD